MQRTIAMPGFRSQSGGARPIEARRWQLLNLTTNNKLVQTKRLIFIIVPDRRSSA